MRSDARHEKRPCSHQRVTGPGCASGRPGIDDGDPAAAEIADVAGSASGFMRARNGSDHGIGELNGPSLTLTGRDDAREETGSGPVEGQDRSIERVLQDEGRLLPQLPPAAALRKNRDAGEDLCLANSRGAELVLWLTSDPALDRCRRQRRHQLRQHIGVEYDHRSKVGGVQSLSRGGSSRSTPPSGPKAFRNTSRRC